MSTLLPNPKAANKVDGGCVSVKRVLLVVMVVVRIRDVVGATGGGDDDDDDACDHSSAQATGLARVSPVTTKASAADEVGTQTFVAAGGAVLVAVLDDDDNGRVRLVVRSSDNAGEKGLGDTQAFACCGRVQEQAMARTRRIRPVWQQVSRSFIMMKDGLIDWIQMLLVLKVCCWLCCCCPPLFN